MELTRLSIFHVICHLLRLLLIVGGLLAIGGGISTESAIQKYKD